MMHEKEIYHKGKKLNLCKTSTPIRTLYIYLDLFIYLFGLGTHPVDVRLPFIILHHGALNY